MLRLLGAVLGAVLLAWGGAELLLHLRGTPAPRVAEVARTPAPAPRAAEPQRAPPPVPPPSVRERAIAATAVPDRAPPPPAAPAPARLPEAPAPMPRVVTPDQEVRWGAGLVTSGISAVDAGTLQRGSELLLLLGIDAPSLGQLCREPVQGRIVACGRQAQAALAALLSFGSVACSEHGSDPLGRIRARCLNGRAEELNRAMVLAGWALAAEGDPTYAAEERQAAAARRGLHGLLFDRPEAWRRANPQ